MIIIKTNSTSKTRFIALLLAIVMVLGLAACGADTSNTVIDGNGDSPVVTAPSPEGTGLPRGNGSKTASGLPRGGKANTDPEKQLKPYGTIETLTKSVKTPSKPDTKNTKMDNSYGTVDWSTAANGYITFTAKGRERGFILQTPNKIQAMFKVAKDDSIKVALTDGAGKYQYAIANVQSSNNGYDIQYKNSFQVKSIDADLMPYLVSTPYGDYENAPAATAKAAELWASGKSQMDNVKALAEYVGGLEFTGKLAHGSLDVYVNPDEVIERGGGICNDLAKLLVAMLRSQGVPAHYQCGLQDGGNHAWVLAWIETGSTTRDGVTASTGAWVNVEATYGYLISHNHYKTNKYSTDTVNYAN